MINTAIQKILNKKLMIFYLREFTTKEPKKVTHFTQTSKEFCRENADTDKRKVLKKTTTKGL
jgi:hypothetical protein